MDKPIGTGLASYGMSGQVFHGPLLKVNPNYQVIKVLERTKNNSRKDFPNAKIVNDFSEIIEDSSIELVIINTPDHLHFSMALAAIKAGKHVVLEKPFVLKVDEGKTLLQESIKHGKILSVFQNRRWDGDFLSIKKIIHEGKLGRIVDYEAHFDRYRTHIQDSWKEDPATGTGTLYNLGSHLIDQALQLFGHPHGVQGELFYLRDGSKVDDGFDVRLHYPGLRVMLRASYLVREPGPRYMVHGTLGSYLKWGIDPQEEDLKAGKLPISEDWGKEDEKYFGILHYQTEGEIVRKKMPTVNGNYPAYYEQLYRSIRGGEELPVKAEDALDTIRTIELVKQSYDEKRILSWQR